jgi:hypothetical protein
MQCARLVQIVSAGPARLQATEGDQTRRQAQCAVKPSAVPFAWVNPCLCFNSFTRRTAAFAAGIICVSLRWDIVGCGLEQWQRAGDGPPV